MSSILKGLTEGYFSRDENDQQNAMDTRRSSDLSRERNVGLDEPDELPATPAETRNGVYEYNVPAGQEDIAQELGLQSHRGHWVSRIPVQRANFQFGRPQFHEIPSQGVAEGSLNEGQYEMMMRNGQVKKFIAKDDADAKRIAAGHGAKSVIRLKGGVPAGKVSEQGVAEGSKEQEYGPEWDEKVKRLGQMAKQGERKTVWDPVKRVYKTVPVQQSAIKEGLGELDENLKQWFKEKWVRFGPDGKIRGDCARGDDSEGKPKCLPQSKAHSLGKKGRASAGARKRREDPNPERSGKAINVNTKKKSNEAVAEGSDQNYQVGDQVLTQVGGRWLPAVITKPINAAGNYGVKFKVGSKVMNYVSSPDQLKKQGVAEGELDEACWKGYHKEGNKKMFGKQYPNCVKNTNEEQEQLDEKCWDTHKQVGMKNKGGKQVPNCVPKESIEDSRESCPECGGPMFSDMMLAEKQDACYNKVKSRYKVWPSAYASGALVQCRKKGAANWGTGGKKDESIEEDTNTATVEQVVSLLAKLNPEEKKKLADELRQELNT